VDGARSALIVAIDGYADPGLRLLRAPASDARALAAVLRDPDIGGFEVQTLLNEPSYVVNLAVEEFFAERRPADLLVVHFSCHGIKDEDGELYFATSNTVLGRLGATAVAAEFVSRRMSRSRSRRVVLLLDCCYAGAFERGLFARATIEMGIGQQFEGRGRAVITASSAMEYAFEAGELTETLDMGPSVFTRALVEGLETGEADRDQDGLVGLDELYDYVYDKVREATPNQTPGKWTFGIQGELYIARRSRPVSTPAPLPPALEQAIESPLAGVRIGAVQELAGLLRGTHAGKALAARAALERLTDDDSRSVASAATAVLGGQAPPRLALSATVIDFGRVPQHGQCPERRVWIGNSGGGVLNARASTAASWLKISQVGDELVIGVDTDSPGAHEGTITVDSDGGVASVRVRVQVHLAQATTLSAPATTRHPPAPQMPGPLRPEKPPNPACAAATSAAAGTAPPIAEAAPAPAAPSVDRAITDPASDPSALAGAAGTTPPHDDPRVAVTNLGPYVREETPATPEPPRRGPKLRDKARNWKVLSLSLAVAAVLLAIGIFIVSSRPTPRTVGSPPGFQVLSMTFVTNTQGFALGSVGCRSGRCIALLGTQDGGVKWRQLTAPTRSVAHLGACQEGGQCVQQIRFADRLNGYAYAPTLFMTTDGGVHWTQIAARVTSLEAADGTVVRVTSRTTGCGGPPYRVELATVGTNSWQTLPVPPISTVCPPVLYRQDSRLVLVGYRNPAGGVRATAQIIISGNGGYYWTSVPDACSGKDGYTSAVALAPPSVLVLLCQHRGPSTAGAFGPAWVRISPDDGVTFGPDEAVPTADRLSGMTHYQLAAATEQRLLVTETGAHGTKVLLTENGGLKWSTPLNVPGGGAFILVGYEDQWTGRVAEGDLVWTTHDGGRTWTSDHFEHS
jgi:Caspase domain